MLPLQTVRNLWYKQQCSIGELCIHANVQHCQGGRGAFLSIIAHCWSSLFTPSKRGKYKSKSFFWPSSAATNHPLTHPKSHFGLFLVGGDLIPVLQGLLFHHVLQEHQEGYKSLIVHTYLLLLTERGNRGIIHRPCFLHFPCRQQLLCCSCLYLEESVSYTLAGKVILVKLSD